MLVVALAAAASATSVGEVPNPRDRASWISDGADVLDEPAEARIDARIEALHRDLGVEIAVVTLDDVEGTPKEFATALFDRWGIGDREANNGLLVLLVLGQRRLEMETGYGLEPMLPDGWLGSMQQQAMVPRFKQGDFGGGIEVGLERIDERLRRSPAEASEGTRGVVEIGGPPPQVPQAMSRGVSPLGVGAGGGAAVLALGGVWWGRRRARTCSKCGVYMPMLDEAADDAHLDAGQRAEERLGSVDYQVHMCPSCSEVRTFARVRWFSGYHHCPGCNVRARKSRSETVRAATRHSGGLVRITETCDHCRYHHSYTRSTPPLPPPSSSSGSGSGSSRRSSSSSRSSGSSFGGGRSGGGGAGSSW